MLSRIHPTSIVSPTSEIDPDVFIGPYCIVGDRVKLAVGVRLDGHCVLEGPLEVGSGTRFFPFSSVGLIPQDLKFKGEETRAVIGERNVFREHTTLHRGTAGGGGVTTVGSDNLFMAGAHVAHDCHIDNHVIFANGAALSGHVRIEDHVTLGAYVGVHQFCRVGKYAFLGAYAVVVKDALPFATTAGNHAKCFGPNVIGLRRKGFTAEQIGAIDHAFRLLLSSKLNTSQALEQVKHELRGRPEIEYLVDFIETSVRGVTK